MGSRYASFAGDRIVLMLKENLLFLREFLLEFKTTGACFPTSKWAAHALITPLREPNRAPKRILELGPGTGSVTIPLIREMQPGDHLTICEINPRFMKALKETLERDESFQVKRDQVEFFEGAAQDIPVGAPFDVIVCALPFVNFDLGTVKDIFAKLRLISTPNTLMTYYEYIGARRINQTIGAQSRKDRMREVNGFLKESGEVRNIDKRQVWLNLFPIHIYTVRPAA
ncbi:MAG: methyltransferase domain-containing protein [Pseudomonadota bacterium]|jgi:phosphatidylethanolamine/phosphatidyl-N-methylethanolamine N-methyltransferase